ncbi:hypothetical protein [Brevibacillus dissolubilis]|uniref:hypothetical protein n=1 Tax=Brevibacillus dissolubilis TaxID=1844116 RepID=UPI00111784A3|nr:hypothetical protein [Brevibacillus dissolubilis]
MFLSVALLTFTVDTIAMMRKNNMRAKFTQHYHDFAVRDIFNTNSYPKPPRFMVVYRNKDKFYRAWLDQEGRILEQERAGE